MDPLNVLCHTLDPAPNIFKKGFINSKLSTCHCWQDPQDPRQSAEPEEKSMHAHEPIAHGLQSGMQEWHQGEELHFRYKVGSG